MDPIAITPSAPVATQQPAPLQASAHYMPQVQQHFEQAYNTYQPIVNDIQSGAIEVQGHPASIGMGVQMPPERNQGGGGYSTGGIGRQYSGAIAPGTGQYETGYPESTGTWQGPHGPTSREYNGGQPITADQMQQGNPARYDPGGSSLKPLGLEIFNRGYGAPSSSDNFYPSAGGAYPAPVSVADNPYAGLPVMGGGGGE